MNKITVTRVNAAGFKTELAVITGNSVGYAIESSPIPHMRCWANTGPVKETVILTSLSDLVVTITTE